MADYTLVAKLTADARDFVSGFDRAQGKLADLQGRVNTFGKRFQTIGNQISRIGDGLTRKITVPAVGAATALTGITLVKGFDRLVGIDTARAKLKGLGHDAGSVESIMESALTSVRGTAFGLDEAATTAANAVAAGIPVGKELTRYLSLTGDAAAIAGTSMSEMGSILNKVTTQGKAYNGELQMLADRGLPIYQWLADEANTTAEAIYDMASNGEISTEMLLNAIEKNIGGAAKVMGEESFSAAIANIGADIARIGAAFLDAGGQAGGFFSTVKPLLTEFRGFLAQVEEKAADFGVAFGQAFINAINTIRELKARFDELSPSVQDLIIKGAAIGTALLVGMGPAISILGRLISGFGTVATVISFLISPIGLIIAGIVALGTAFGIAMAKSEEFRSKVFEAFEFVRNAVSGLTEILGGQLLNAFEVIKSVVSTAVDVIWQFVSSISEGFKSAGGDVSTLTTLLFGLNPVLTLIRVGFTQFGPQISTAFSEIAAIALPVVTQLGQMLGQLAAAIIPMLMNVISALLPIIMQLGMTILEIVSTALPIFLEIFTQLVPIIMMVVMTVLELVGQLAPLVNILIGSLVPVIMVLIDAILNIVQAVAPALIAILGAVAEAFRAVIPAVVAIVGVVVNVVATIISAITPIIAFVAGVISSIMSIIAPIVTFIAGIIQSIFAVISPIVSFVSGVFNTVFTIISSVFRNAFNVVSTIISSISRVISTLSGIVSGVFNRVFSIISNVMNRVRTVITSVFTAIQNAWNGLTGFVSGVFSGIESAVKQLVNQVKGFVNGVIRGINAAISLINKIPGVSISPIPQLQRGTDNWEGGFARINEGGRGELVLLPSGTQVIPHDVSMRYAREAGRQQASRQVVINKNDGELVAKAVNSLEESLSRLQLVMDERVVAEILEEPITEIQERNQKILHTFK